MGSHGGLSSTGGGTAVLRPLVLSRRLGWRAVCAEYDGGRLLAVLAERAKDGVSMTVFVLVSYFTVIDTFIAPVLLRYGFKDKSTG